MIFWLIAIGSIALFLLGANCAFLFHLNNRLVPWFTFKVSAVTLLLVYVAVSVFYESQTWWKMLIALMAVLIDLAAFYRMWAAIQESASKGVTGLVPILRDEKKN